MGYFNIYIYINDLIMNTWDFLDDFTLMLKLLNSSLSFLDGE